MPDLARDVVREPGATSAVAYARRVTALSFIYCLLFAGALVGLSLILWWGRYLVTLSQRSNVETLTILFLVVFFAYVAYLSWGGASGAVQLGRDLALVRTGRRANLASGREGSRDERGAMAALNVVVERDGRPGEPLLLEVADRDGAYGALVVEGARIEHRGVAKGSNELLAYFAEQIAALVARTDPLRIVEVVGWSATGDEHVEEYLAQVDFARNLRAQLAAGPLWPTVTLSEADCAELTRALSVVCESVRKEAYLPDWEYSAEHKLPIIPEPLGLITLSRSERRVDPLASMGCATAVVLGVVLILVLLIVIPPWVPGA